MNSFNTHHYNKSSSYSELINHITEGNVESLTLIPLRREVIIYLNNGLEITIPVLPNDQYILRYAKDNQVPITVKDISSELALEASSANFTMLFLFIIIASYMFGKILKIANKSISFINGKTNFIDSSDIRSLPSISIFSKVSENAYVEKKIEVKTIILKKNFIR